MSGHVHMHTARSRTVHVQRCISGKSAEITFASITHRMWKKANAGPPSLSHQDVIIIECIDIVVLAFQPPQHLLAVKHACPTSHEDSSLLAWAWDLAPLASSSACVLRVRCVATRADVNARGHVQTACHVHTYTCAQHHTPHT